MDFINTYVPASVELTAEEIEDTRDRLERYSRNAWPQLDTSPNTVLGDLVLTPQAYNIAALEVGLNRFASDLCLANVASGIIYNCEFVSEYLKNFNVDTSATLKSSGVVRLGIATNKQYVLDRSTLFQFGNYVFSLYLPNVGPLIINPVGATPVADANNVQLIDSGSELFFVDIPVVGLEGAVEVKAGAAGLISVMIPEITTIVALDDFNDGVVTNSLCELAKQTQSTIYSASLNTRNGAVRYVKDVCPFVESVYALCGNDHEVLRSTQNAYGINSGAMDVYARSKSYKFTEQQYVDLIKSGNQFVGVWNYVGIPYLIESVVIPQNIQPITYRITSENRVPTGFYTTGELLTVEVNDVVDEAGDSLLPTFIDKDGNTHITLQINYRTDVLLPSIIATTTNSDVTPVNTSILTRGFVPVVIDSFEVEYVKSAGIVPTLTDAKERIETYLTELGAPNVYSDGVISDIMNEAGAHYMRGINVQAKVQWTIGGYYGDGTGIHEVPNVDIFSSEDLRINYPGKINIPAGSQFACSPKNIRYVLRKNAVTFKEVREM